MRLRQKRFRRSCLAIQAQAERVEMAVRSKPISGNAWRDTATRISITHNRKVVVRLATDQSFQVRNGKRYEDSDTDRERIGKPVKPKPALRKHSTIFR